MRFKKSPQLPGTGRTRVKHYHESHTPTSHRAILLHSYYMSTERFPPLVNIPHTTQNSQNKQIKISDLETNIFELKMMMKSGLEFFILKSYQPLQSCCCPVQKNLPRKAELAWQVSRYLRRGQQNFKIKNSRPLFTIIFSSKMLVSRSEILVHLFQFQAV